MPVTPADVAASDRIRAEQERKEVSKRVTGKNVVVYVCPTEGCPDYYGAAGMPQLEDQIVAQRGMNFEKRPESNHHSRAQCPTCRAKGDRIDRVRVELFVPDSLFAVATT